MKRPPFDIRLFDGSVVNRLNTIMEKQWNHQIETWKDVRNKADNVIKETLKSHFPGKYGYPHPTATPKSIQQEESKIGRTLWIYARSDLTIKTMQMNQENRK